MGFIKGRNEVPSVSPPEVSGVCRRRQNMTAISRPKSHQRLTRIAATE
jgi:hypothetical protein